MIITITLEGFIAALVGCVGIGAMIDELLHITE